MRRAACKQLAGRTLAVAWRRRYSCRMRFHVAAAFVLTVPLLAQEGALTAEQQQRADAIHARVLTLDTHKDIEPQLAPEELPDDPATRERFRAEFDPTVRGTQQVDFPKMREGGYDCAFFIVYVAHGRLDGGGYARALRAANAKFDAIHRMCRLHGDTIGLATSPDDVVRLHRDGKLIACIGIENGYPMGEDLGLIARFHERGARYMSITHNGHTQLGDSHTPPEPMHGGLSELGRKAIAEMNRVGIMVDVSHAAKSTMMQAVAASRAPVIASHSGARALADHTRNLDDEQLRALAAKGGVIQCVALADFVKVDRERSAAVDAWMKECGVGRHRGDGVSDDEAEQRWRRFRAGMAPIDAKHPRADVRAFVDHVDHVVKTVGIDHVGISSDFDGGGGVTGWNDASEAPNVTRELVRRGYTEEQIGKIWSGNLLRVWREVEKVAAATK
jgi:membrane dipeptidase